MQKEMFNSVCKKVNNLYTKTMKEIDSISHAPNVGGRIRYMNGALGEKLSETAWAAVGSHYANLYGFKFETLKGDERKIECTNENGNAIQMQVDRHQYIDGDLIHIEECKAYLDRCYLIRASDDCRMIRKYTKSNISSSVLAIENSVKKESYDFIMDEGHIGSVSFLTDGKRSSTKPIWKKENHKPLNHKKLKEYVQSIMDVFEERLKGSEVSE